MHNVIKSCNWKHQSEDIHDSPSWSKLYPHNKSPSSMHKIMHCRLLAEVSKLIIINKHGKSSITVWKQKNLVTLKPKNDFLYEEEWQASRCLQPLSGMQYIFMHLRKKIPQYNISRWKIYLLGQPWPTDLLSGLCGNLTHLLHAFLNRWFVYILSLR